MNALALALAMLGIEASIPYDPFADRLRFPPDKVLHQWKRNNRAYLEQLREQQRLMAVSPNVHARQALEREICECERIGQIIWEIAEPTSITDDRSIMIQWMCRARGLMTEEEYRAGYISFMGLPHFSLHRLPRP